MVFRGIRWCLKTAVREKIQQLLVMSKVGGASWRRTNVDRENSAAYPLPVILSMFM